jgi:hypothetical protein
MPRLPLGSKHQEDGVARKTLAAERGGRATCGAWRPDDSALALERRGQVRWPALHAATVAIGPRAQGTSDQRAAAREQAALGAPALRTGGHHL